MLRTMASDPNESPILYAADPNRRGLLVVVGLLIVVLVVGGAIVAKSFMTIPIPRKVDGAGTAQRDGAAAIEAGLGAAATYQREGKYLEAAAILLKLSEQSPADQAVRIAYAQALLGQKNYAEAYQQYEAAIKLSEGVGKPIRMPGDNDPSAVEPVGTKRNPILANLHFETGTSANMSGQNDRAEEHYWMAQVLDAAEPRYPLFLGMMQIKKGDDDAAAASLLRAVKISPELAEGWGTLAELELKKNQNTLAAQHIEKARALQPDLSRWRIVHARVLNRQGDAEQAAAILQALPQSDRSDRGVLALQAESYGLLKKPMLAAQMYEQAGNLVPSDSEIAYAAAQWFDRAGEKAKAMQYAQKAKMLGQDGAKELLEAIEKK